MNIYRLIDQLAIEEAERVARRNAAIVNIDVMNFLHGWGWADWNNVADPGNAGAISPGRTGICNLTSAGTETRTLAAPLRSGLLLGINMLTYVGNVTLTVASAYDAAGNTTITFSAAGQVAWLISRKYGTTHRWSLFSGGPNDDSVLNGLVATAAEINRVAKPSTRVIAAGAATLTVTQALHDGKTILLDQATGVAVTLPAMTGSGSRYRFVCSVATSGGSQVITATGAHLFGGIVLNTDTTVTSLFTAVAAANPSGSTVITLNGSTTGGRKGDWVEIEDVATSIGIVRGMLNGSGTEATPFS